MTKHRLNDGWDLRRGSIAGTQPGEKPLQDEPARKRVDRSRYKPVQRPVSDGGIVRQRRATGDPGPTRRQVSLPEPEPIEEWDNPYRKRKMDKGTALHVAALRKSREQAASDPNDPVVRMEIIKRDGPICWVCKKLLAHKDIELDHVVPLVRGGKHVPENLRVSCRSCNAWHGDRLIRPL